MHIEKKKLKGFTWETLDGRHVYHHKQRKKDIEFEIGHPNTKDIHHQPWQHVGRQLWDDEYKVWEQLSQSIEIERKIVEESCAP